MGAERDKELKEILVNYKNLVAKDSYSSEETRLYELKHGNKLFMNKPLSKWFSAIRIFLRIEELRLEERLEKPWEVDSEFWKESKDPYGPGAPWWEDESKNLD
ncbi:hypothetical protein HZA97_02375 [Candidatus Woesearchaeota archaeon]|nr:hypothetical protein [Candidatus Woesearchaeota archaeon]